MDPHGYLEFTWKDDVLYLRSFGPFNEEGVMEAVEAYHRQLDTQAPEVFAVIEVLTYEALGFQQTMEDVEAMWRLLGERGCRALAVVYANEIQHELAVRHLPPFGRLFANESDAETWVAGEMA